MIAAPDPQLEPEAARLLGRFAQAGAVRVDPPVLQPADVLLDLYGEDIRARAYVTRDPELGELMLRPDFTVPVVQMHMANGREPARYCYAGKVFRVQEAGRDRPVEFDQVGFELFDGDDPAAADAEVFALFAEVVAPLGLRAATGDLGVLTAAVRGLSTSERRKAALLRHIWRPRRFRALLDRYGGRAPVPPTRAALVERMAAGEDVLAVVEPAGLRSREEIADRLAALAADAAEPPVSAAEVDLLDAIVELRLRAPDALARLHDVAVDLPAIGGAVDRMDARLDALAAKGVDVAALEFEGSYGRTTLEYYDGFVFGFHSDLLPGITVAGGGRYDALTRVLGDGAGCPAVGGVIRPALTLALS